MAKCCWLVFQEGVLTCTVLHRKKGICELDRKEANDG